MKFGFIIHPISSRDLSRKYPLARFLPGKVVEQMLLRMKPMLASEVKGIRSLTGETTEGVFVGCPLTPHQMLTLPVSTVYESIVAATTLAAQQGAEIVGLGAFTAVVGDGGITVAKRSPVAITTGNSYTVATAIEGVLKACGLVGIFPNNSTLAVVGATGSIGKTCAEVLSRSFGRTVLVGRDLKRTQAVADGMNGATATTDIEAIREADAIVTVTSSDAVVILPQHLKPGSVVCDVARPRDVSVRVVKERSDVLVIEGGVVKVPGDPDFGINFGFPPKTAYACMSETIMLALEGRAENFTVGKDVSVAQVDETWRWAAKHGFELAGFRSFEKEVSEEAISRARDARATYKPATKLQNAGA